MNTQFDFLHTTQGVTYVKHDTVRDSPRTFKNGKGNAY
jgi:hypothetical protein